MASGVIIVSNRLPVSVRRAGQGKLEFYPSVGGLATGLSSYVRNQKNKWIGWPGIASDDLSVKDRTVISRELLKQNCYPVFLSKKQIDSYYNGYSNSVLWPLLHDMKPSASQHKKWWESYKEVNQIFADETIRLTYKSSTIWVHDYQLMLLPKALRANVNTTKIGFFLHVPFPRFEQLKTLSTEHDLVEGMLGSDLIGFQTSGYTEAFLDCCTQLDVGVVTGKQVILPTRVVTVTKFPISIDYTKFLKAGRRIGVQREFRRLKSFYRGQRVVLTVDRLDPTKGLVERLEAYESFLKESPSLLGKVVMVMLAVPSRTEIDEYKKLKKNLEKLVDKVNKKFGNDQWKPVDYLYTSLPFEKLAALYQIADIAFIAPIRDGMNLVAKEFVASKPKRSGVLILSSTAGAAEELHDALIVNPNQPKSLIRALEQSLSMPRSESRMRLERMQAHLKVHTIYAWADSFMAALEQPVPTIRPHTKLMTTARVKMVVREYQKAKQRLILLAYDGVLEPFKIDFEDARPSSDLRKLLQNLAIRDGNKLVIISGRNPTNLLDWFGDIPIDLAAEHGILIRQKNQIDWQATQNRDSSWQAKYRPILEKYARITPGAKVETKQYGLVWHYRAASPYFAQKNLVIMKKALKPQLKIDGLEMKSGKKILEIRPAGTSKGKATTHWLHDDLDFILAIGDDYTDEDTFRALPSSAYTIKVGKGRTLAQFRISNVDKVIALLKVLANT